MRALCWKTWSALLNRFRTDETRRARRLARIARWDQPLSGALSRLRAWTNMVLVDHGVFRLVYLNRHQVTTRLWRSAQPAPHQLARFAREGGRTIVNLRGGREHGSWPLQREACERFGLTLTEFVVRSREAPDRATILAARDFFEGLAYPALVHCKSGADRAGFFAALYLVLHEGRPVREAMGQLHPRFGHFRFAKTGILDAFFEAYLAEGEAKGLSFLDWVERVYDPQALTERFRASFWSGLLVDRLLRRE
jgi:protein tyrosine/serine phosphatase